MWLRLFAALLSSALFATALTPGRPETRTSAAQIEARHTRDGSGHGSTCAAALADLTANRESVAADACFGAGICALTITPSSTGFDLIADPAPANTCSCDGGHCTVRGYASFTCNPDDERPRRLELLGSAAAPQRAECSAPGLQPEEHTLRAALGAPPAAAWSLQQ